MSKGRITWIDNVKGFGIMMIMLAHVIQNFPEYNPLNTYVCSFHVPIFFIISGYVAALSSRDKVSRKRVIALLIPYVIFSCFNSAIKFLVLGLQHALSVDIIRGELIELLITGNGTVWFLMTLLLTELLYIYVLRKIGNSNIRTMTSLLLIVIAFILPDANNPFLVVLYRVILATGFYGLGYAFNTLEVVEVKASSSDSTSRRYSELSDNKMIIAILLICGLIIEKVWGCGVDFFNGSFTKPVASIIASIATSLGWILLIRLCDTAARKVIDNADGQAKANRTGIVGKILNYMGTNSIIAMLVHPIVLMVILYPFGNLIRSFSGSMAYAAGLALYVLLCILQVPCIWIINNYMPFLIGKRK